MRVTKFCRLFVNVSWIKFDTSDLDNYVGLHSIALSYRDDNMAGGQTKGVCLDQFEFKIFHLRRGQGRLHQERSGAMSRAIEKIHVGRIPPLLVGALLRFSS